MDAIKTYLDNVFAAFPQNERVKTLKREMLAGMEEKYHALKDEGKSEHEAVGGVIANFGSIDEVIAELGIEPVAEKQSEGLCLSHEEVYEYIEQTKKSSVWIGLGVWLILTGVAAMILINNTVSASAAGVFVLLLAVAGAVPIFIVNGICLERYEHYDEQKILMDAATRAETERQSKWFMPRFVAQLCTGIALIIIAVGALIFFSKLDYGKMAALAMLLFTIGFSTFLFITSGMLREAYDTLLGQGDYKNKAANNKIAKITGTIAAVYWPAMVAAYLLWSFISGAWHISWVIWPVAGVMFGAIAGGIGAWYGTNSDN